jgi:cell division protein FtsQ
MSTTSLRDARAQKQRLKQRRRRRLKIAALAVAVLALAGFLVWVVAFSSAFAAKRVEVTGAVGVDPNEVVAVAQVPLGTPLVRLDTEAIAERVAAAIDAVEDVSVTRHIFGAVEIHITERRAVYAVVDGPQVTLVDAEGKAYLVVAAVPEGLLPATVPDPTERLLADTATVVAALPAALRDQVLSVTTTSIDHIEFALVSGATLLWGSADQSDVKGEVALSLMAAVVAGYYDVSSPSHPATRP